jgi:ribosomal subunit interface protein
VEALSPGLSLAANLPMTEQTTYEIPFRIVYRDFEETDAIRSAIEKCVAKLERHKANVINCEIALSTPHRSKYKGRQHKVEIRLHVPGEDIFITRDPGDTETHEDNLYATIYDAFDALERQLDENTRKMRRDVKHHELPPEARIAKVFHLDGYGFIETQDGREIYFHKNSILGAKFENLEIGQKVRFTEEMGEKGPQVTSMRLRTST